MIDNTSTHKISSAKLLIKKLKRDVLKFHYNLFGLILIKHTFENFTNKDLNKKI